MKSSWQRMLCTLAVPFVVLPSLVLAASDGIIGSSSGGESDIMVVVPQFVEISAKDGGVQQINKSGLFNGRGHFCIHTNMAPHKATLRFASKAANQDNGNTSDRHFTLRNSHSSLSYEVSIASQKSKTSSDADCQNEKKATFSVDIATDGLSAIPQGTYRGELALLVEPV